MLKYELATSLTLNIEKCCYSYLYGLADFWCLRGGSLPIARCASKGIPLYIVFINREILPRPEDARICFTFFLRQRGISMTFKEVFY